jgi:NAD(P)-dependent dehydrogenase (short-subunit alcohol dehydrogenase family)
MNNPFSMHDKTVLVVGASSGIGQASAIMLSQMGAKLIITGRNEKNLQHTMESLSGDGHSVFIGDLVKQENREKLVETLPNIDGMFYSAGISRMFPLKYMRDDTLDDLFAINFFSPIKITRSLIKKKLLNQGASLLYMSSIAPFIGISGQIGYAASKGAVSAMIKILAKELASQKIRANCLCPAMINTPLLDGAPISEEIYKKDQSSYPLGGYGEPNDVAAAAVYFLSPASKWVTGTNFIMDGGLTLL